jgi:succinate dehydrogenase hydrophobic anchor subunit
MYWLLKPDISPDDGWRIPMKELIFAALAALSLVAAVLHAAYAARTVARDAVTRKRQTGPLG